METLELLLTVLISGIANYVIVRERLLVLETKFQYTKNTVEELSQNLKSLERTVLKSVNRWEATAHKASDSG